MSNQADRISKIVNAYNRLVKRTSYNNTAGAEQSAAGVTVAPEPIQPLALGNWKPPSESKSEASKH